MVAALLCPLCGMNIHIPRHSPLAIQAQRAQNQSKTPLECFPVNFIIIIKLKNKFVPSYSCNNNFTPGLQINFNIMIYLNFFLNCHIFNTSVERNNHLNNYFGYSITHNGILLFRSHEIAESLTEVSLTKIFILQNSFQLMGCYPEKKYLL